MKTPFRPAGLRATVAIGCASALFAVLGAIPMAQAGRDTVGPGPVFIPSGPVFIPPLSYTPPADNSTDSQGENPPEPISGQAINAATTAKIGVALAGARVFCSAQSAAAYRVDCLADQLEQVAKRMPDTGDYADAKEIIQQASRSLAGVAKRNRSSEKRPAEMRSGGAAPASSSRPLIPVAPNRDAAAAAEATAILNETETLLLRSGESSARRKVAYQDIAQALGSNKILLRSA